MLQHPIYNNYKLTDDFNAVIGRYGRIIKMFINKDGYWQFSLCHGSKVKSMRFHRFKWECINGLIPAGMLIDHINRNRLDNDIINLRLVGYQENALNSKNRKGSSKYRGVSWNKQRKKWHARIKINQKMIHLGLFDNEIDAAKAYDRYNISIGRVAINFTCKVKVT